MSKIVEFKRPYPKRENNIDMLLRLVKNNTKELDAIIESEKIEADDLCILVEELCRYERIQTLNFLLDKYNEVLYYHECDVLDVAVGTCNIDLIKMILSKYDKAYSPSIKYESSCYRAIENKRTDILELLKKHNVNII